MSEYGWKTLDDYVPSKRKSGVAKLNSKEKRRIKRKLIAAHGSFCKYCGQQFSMAKLTIDHVIPRAHGGGNNIKNLALACLPCNNQKGDKRG